VSQRAALFPHADPDSIPALRKGWHGFHPPQPSPHQRPNAARTNPTAAAKSRITNSAAMRA